MCMVHIGHIFYNVNATVSFGIRLTLSIFRFQNFSLDSLTNWLTAEQNQLLNPFMHEHSGEQTTWVRS